MAISRTLGEGRIIKLEKKYGFIQDEKLGRIYFPATAALLVDDIDDLRAKFVIDEVVVFTAQRQIPPQNDCQYMASSVVKRNELLTCSGKIIETSDKFAYAEVPRLGRVFLPFSARNAWGRSWLGKGSAVGVCVDLRVIPQPEMNHCRYVAFACSLTGSDPALSINNGDPNFPPLNGRLSSKVDRQPDYAPEQVGIVISVTLGPQGVAVVYAPQTGLSRLTGTVLASLNSLKIGTWLRYAVNKSAAAVDASLRCNWNIVEARPLGDLLPVVPDRNDPRKLMIDAVCVVNRVSGSNRAAWLWNDLIGRVYVPSACFLSRLKPFSVVKTRVVYAGSFEDVPWCAVDMNFVGDDDKLLSENGTLLISDDGWEVTYVSMHPTGSFFGFMEHERFGSAFVAWTDVAEGEAPLVQGTKCRATVYKQYRDRKHLWRVVVVSPLNTSGQPLYHHPLKNFYKENGYSNPVLTKIFASPPPPQPLGHLPTVQSSQQLLPASPQINSGLQPVQRTASAPPTNSSSAIPDLTPLDLSGMPVSSETSSMSSEQAISLDPNSVFSFDALPMKNVDDWFTRWTPSHFDAFPPTKKDNGKITAEASTQTEALSEQLILRDLVDNHELLMKIFEAQPKQVERILSIKWQIQH